MFPCPALTGQNKSTDDEFLDSTGASLRAYGRTDLKYRSVNAIYFANVHRDLRVYMRLFNATSNFYFESLSLAVYVSGQL